ncbi:hypothetical protein DMENIID0001_155500 [Sergentomyia squamirostris]
MVFILWNDKREDDRTVVAEESKRRRRNRKARRIVTEVPAQALRPGSPPRKTILIQVVRSDTAGAKRRWLREQGESNQHHPDARNREAEGGSDEGSTAREYKKLPRAARILPWRTWTTIPVGTVMPASPTGNTTRTVSTMARLRGTY